MKKLTHAWRHHPWLSLAFLLAMVLAVVFAARAIWMAVYWAGEEENPDLQAWMTPRYVIHTWDIKPRELRQLLAASEEEAEEYKEYTLGQIAKLKGQTFADFSQQLQQQLMQLQAAEKRDRGHEDRDDD